ncbi:hypothetical protein [Azospirillum doebereinerae]
MLPEIPIQNIGFLVTETGPKTLFDPLLLRIIIIKASLHLSH